MMGNVEEGKMEALRSNLKKGKQLIHTTLDIQLEALRGKSLNLKKTTGDS